MLNAEDECWIFSIQTTGLSGSDRAGLITFINTDRITGMVKFSGSFVSCINFGCFKNCGPRQTPSMTDFWMMIVIAIGLAMDCFAVSLGIGASPSPCTPRSIFRLSFHFGLFQGGMTLLGWLLGSTVVNLIASVDHWTAMLLLSWVGGRMIYEGIFRRDEQTEIECNDPTRGSSLVVLSIATSIDALGVGLSIALLNLNILIAGLLIGLVSLTLSIVGLMGGSRLSSRFGKNMEGLGGLVLIAIGLRIVITHLMV